MPLIEDLILNSKDVSIHPIGTYDQDDFGGNNSMIVNQRIMKNISDVFKLIPNWDGTILINYKNNLINYLKELPEEVNTITPYFIGAIM